MSNISTVSAQWASRPDDQRFVTLNDLHEVVHGAKKTSVQGTALLKGFSFGYDADNSSALKLIGSKGTESFMTNWSYRQMAEQLGVPAGYVSSLPGELAARNLNYALSGMSETREAGLLATNLGSKEKPVWQTRAVTGPGYGRVYNSDIVATMIKVFGNGRDGVWKVPGEFGVDVEVTKANTTIYGSDRDIFVFLCDEKNRIELPNRRNGAKGSLARGFYVSNGECGDKPLIIASFLFDYACSNRTIWGVEGFKQVRIKHTSGAPDRWIEQIQPTLAEYHNAKASDTERVLIAAQAHKLDDVNEFLIKKVGFNAKQAELIKAAHKSEENRPIENAWDSTVGITAFAKSIPFTDERVKVEAYAGKVLDMVAKAA